MRRRSPAAALAVGVLVVAAALAGCESPVPFHPPGEGPADGPVVDLGGAAPYVRTRPPAATGAPDPEAPLPSPPLGGGATGGAPVRPSTSPVRLYVANGPVIDVIDPVTARIVQRIGAGPATARVVPSFDLRRLWATDLAHGTLTPVGPRSGARGRAVAATEPAGLYFTPDERDALVLAGRARRLDVRDPRTMRPRLSVPLPCAAAHADFTPDGASLLASCAGAGRLLRVDVARRQVTGTIRLPDGARPGDLRLSPDGARFYVADPARGGVWVIAARPTVGPPGFVPTGPGARGLALDRDARRLFVVGDAALTALDLAGGGVAARWPLPRGGSPAPGGLSADGAELWLADAAGMVYAVSTRTGRTLRQVWVGGRPSALLVHPQPGRYSLGGTGLYR
ncbi:YncE family protein [Actinomadura sp. NEAU-AAG7]|uniref:YncE family protein n=1 Tax=Actinomadura sp. NEAU-AAG7 TaxID=2839640 RepID=UPI001BE4A272|nr:YncE family protein [Actinomadura sp. NEAU-AAG7]MBT2210623.1 YncE family protein [Actinomadura sp. NEAU-AAG7]